MRIGFIGVGNMGGAIACAAAKAENAEIFVSSFDEAAAERISEKIDCVKLSNESLARSCDFLFLGVKPNVIPSVCK
jgi:pyrroline-5-carboxylate reductase